MFWSELLSYTFCVIAVSVALKPMLDAFAPKRSWAHHRGQSQQGEREHERQRGNWGGDMRYDL